MKLRKYLDNQIQNWNVWFPFDYVWRKKYNVPFGSKKHRETSFFDMMFDLLEEKKMIDLYKKLNEIEYEEEISEGKEIMKLSEKEIEKEFENLDLSKF